MLVNGSWRAPDVGMGKELAGNHLGKDTAMVPRTPRADSPNARRSAGRHRSFSGRRRARAAVEALEDRLVLSTYTWTGWVNGAWDIAGNWLNNQVPPSGSSVLFQPPSSQKDPATGKTYPVGSTTIDLGSEDVSSIQMNGSYEFAGNQANSSLTLDDNATITTATAAALNFDKDGTITNDVTVNFSGSATKSGGGALGINTQNIGYPKAQANVLRPIKIGTGPITVGNSTTMIKSLIQLNTGATLVVPGGENPRIGSLTGGGGIVQMGLSGDPKHSISGVPANLLSINTPQYPSGQPDVFSGDIEGANGGGGLVEMDGVGSLQVGSINPDGTGLFQVAVNSGTLLVSSTLTAQTLAVPSVGSSSATFGGPATMTITGPPSGSSQSDVTFKNKATFAVVLDGAPSTGAFTQLTDTDKDINAQSTVQLGGSQLSVSLGSGYTPKPGEQFKKVISTPQGTIHGQFANAADGSIDVFDNVPFRVSYDNKNGKGDATSITLTVEALPTTTTVVLDSSSLSPSTYGRGETFDAQVAVTGFASGTPIATGSVEFFDGNPAIGGTPLKNGNVPLNSGKASYSTSTLGVAGSPHQIYAEYVPDSTSLYTTSTTAKPSSASISPATTTMSLSSSANPSGSGTPVTITATVGAASGPATNGSVTFSQGTTTLAVVPLSPDGTATFVTPSLAPGDHPITAAFASSTGDYLPVTASLTQAVNPYTTTVRLTLVAQRAKRGKRVYELMATVLAVASPGVAPLPSGTVAFQRNGRTIGSAPLQGGVAVLQIGRTPPRSKRFTATFPGNSEFSGSTVMQVL
jgi:hypothetical protein